MHYQSPEARLSIRMSRRIDWNLGYQYYNYNESRLATYNQGTFIVSARPQNYHAHCPTPRPLLLRRRRPLAAAGGVCLCLKPRAHVGQQVGQTVEIPRGHVDRLRRADVALARVPRPASTYSGTVAEPQQRRSRQSPRRPAAAAAAARAPRVNDMEFSHATAQHQKSCDSCHNSLTELEGLAHG